MATRVLSRPVPPPLRSGGGNRRHSRSSLYLVHTPTLEPMVDEESEEGDVDSSPAPSTPSAELDRERQLSSGSSAEDTTPAFQVDASPLTGGRGLFATRFIPKGAIILSERPLFTQPLHPARSNSSVMSALSRCTREQQREFFTLWNAYKTSRPGHRALLPALGIFETNALPCGVNAVVTNNNGGMGGIGLTGSVEIGREGVFMQASRLNHSCRPNVSRSWSCDTQEMVFRALRDIQSSEELCMHYAGIDILGTRQRRRAEIEEVFGFVCACDTCALEGEDGEESDKRRATVRRLYEEIGQCGNEPTLGLRKVKIALRMLKEEQLVHYEATFSFDAFQLCIMVSDFVNAKAWVRKAWEASCTTSGPDSPATRTFKMYWANPRTHQLAGTLPRMTLYGPD